MKFKFFNISVLVVLLTVISHDIAKPIPPEEEKKFLTIEELDKSREFDVTLQIKPSETNSAITYWDSVHVVFYNPQIVNNKIMLWLGGTGGIPKRVGTPFFKVALEHKYRVIQLSYISRPAGTAVCAAPTLYPTCYEDFRQARAYGDVSLPTIPDQPHDAIIPRFVKLLQYLDTTDPRGEWGNYLDGDNLRWDKICIAGQSMGGGMGLYIAKKEKVDRVIAFSGGWDVKSVKPRVIAVWYSSPGVTPGNRLYGVYHAQEALAGVLAQLYPACDIPESQIYRLDEPLRNPNARGRNPYHGEGISNPVYKPIWETMLGSGI